MIIIIIIINIFHFRTISFTHLINTKRVIVNDLKFDRPPWKLVNTAFNIYVGSDVGAF